MGKYPHDPSYLRAAMVSIAVILLIPLPAALIFGGWEWIFPGWSAIPKEFVFTYLGGMVVLAGRVAYPLLKERFTKDK